MAITATPEIVRVAFLRRIGMSLLFSLGFKALIIVGLGGTVSRWYFAAILVFT
jgi:hypothetical protein